MSQFKKMLQQAADTFTNDDELDNVIVIVVKKPVDGKIEQHTLCDIGAPIAHIIAALQESAQQIVEEKVSRLGADTKES